MAIPEEGKFEIFDRAGLHQAAGIAELPNNHHVASDPHHGCFNGGFCIELGFETPGGNLPYVEGNVDPIGSP